MPGVSEIVSLNFLVVGDILTIHEELRRLSERHTVKHVPNTSRQQIIANIGAAAAEHRFDILFLLDGSLNFAPVNKEILACLLPSLRFVSGIGAGFDHVDVNYLASHGVYYSNIPNAIAFSTAIVTAVLVVESVRAEGVRHGGHSTSQMATPSDLGTKLGIKHLDISEFLVLGMKVAQSGCCDLYEGFLEQGGGKIKVAVKELRGLSSEGDRFQMVDPNHFLREVKVWEGLNHRNIVPFLGYSTVPQCGLRLISPWYENGNLMQYLHSHPDANRPQLLLDVLYGMDYLESCGIVHGDLKSLNILVDQDGRARLCDFGATRFLESVTGLTTSTQNTKATLRFTSPERFLVDGPPTKASDIWAFGCIVIEVIARQRPHEHLSYYQTCDAIMKGKSPLNPNYDKSVSLGPLFWDFIGRCWEIDPTQRPTIDQLLYHVRISFSDEVHIGHNSAGP